MPSRSRASSTPVLTRSASCCAAGRAQAAPAEPRVERPDRAAVVRGGCELRVQVGERAQPEGREHIRLAQAVGRPPRRGRRERAGPEQPAELGARALDLAVAGLDGHRLRSEVLLDPRGKRLARLRSAPSSPRSTARARSATSATACVSASAIGGSGAVPSSRRIPPPWPDWIQRVDGVAPALVHESAGGRSRPVPHETAAALERALEPVAGGAPALLQIVRQRGVAQRGQHHQKPGRRVRGAVVAQLTVADQRAPARSPRSARPARAGTRGRSCPAPRR